MRTTLLTAGALVAFAANSLLCRLALADAAIDAMSFTTVRLFSGAVTLLLLAWSRSGTALRGGSWRSAIALFSYAVPFSIAYLMLDAGIGALILFGLVQATMIGWGIMRGERPRAIVWVGLAIALAGLVGLTAPGATAPDPFGSIAMAIAGVGWGIYSLYGRTTQGDPLVATAGNFARSVPLVLVVAAPVVLRDAAHASFEGIVLATASGALASGVGYSLWYAALRGLTATRAAILQLLVPILAAVGGVVLLSEVVTMRLLLAGAAILCGVGLAIRGRS